MLPLVSVLIPLYNAQQYIADTIIKIKRQTYPNIEVIIVDDHSTDESLKVAQQYASEQIHVYVNPLKGGNSARNYAFLQSKGEYVKFMDADDYCSDNLIKSQIEPEKIRNQKQYNRMKSLNMQSETIQKWKENTGNQKLYSETREFRGESDQSRFEKSDQSASIDSPQKCRHIWLRIFLIILSLCILCFPINRPSEVTFLDVGQGDAIFLRTEQGITCLIDGGSTTVSDVGTYRILPFLKARDVSALDYLFLSHMDADHISGAEELLKDQFHGIPIHNLCLSALPEDETRLRLEKEARSYGTNLLYISRGTVFQEENAKIRCLSPAKNQKKEDENENSQVLLVDLNGLRFLFTGDLGEEGEQELLASGLDLKADILKVGHHGSRYSTSETFLQAVRPKLAVISCAEENRYGHPAPETIQRLERAGCRIFYTMKSGAITLYPADGKKGWKLEQKFDRIERGDSHEHS